MQFLKSKTRLCLTSVLHSCEIYLFSVWGSNVLQISQGNCGSSYAFSATGSIEGAVALGYGYLERLSEQNLIDCSSELEICSILCTHYVRTVSCQIMKENSLSSETPLSIYSALHFSPHTVPEGNHGCNGGNMYNSFMYVIDNEGIDTADGYPYQAIVSDALTTILSLSVLLLFLHLPCALVSLFSPNVFCYVNILFNCTLK